MSKPARVSTQPKTIRLYPAHMWDISAECDLFVARAKRRWAKTVSAARADAPQDEGQA